jgi:hypothetical protein
MLFAQDAVGVQFLQELESYLSGRSDTANGKEHERIERLINDRMQRKYIHACDMVGKLITIAG